MQHILAIGADASLLYTRGLVLEKTGMEVSAATPEQSLLLLQNSHFDLLVICHSVIESDIQRLCTASRLVNGTQVLLIEAPTSLPQAAVHINNRFLPEGGPAELVNRVRDLLL